MKPEFEIKYHARRDLLKWLESNFDYFKDGGCRDALDEIVENKEVIFSAVSAVLNQTYKLSGEPIRKYYEHDLPDITAAYKKNDIREFADAVKSLKAGIEWE